MNKISRKLLTTTTTKTPNPFTTQVIHRAECWVGPCGESPICLLDCRYLSSSLRNQVWWFSCLWYVHGSECKRIRTACAKTMLACLNSNVCHLLLCMYICVSALYCTALAVELPVWLDGSVQLHYFTPAYRFYEGTPPTGGTLGPFSPLWKYNFAPI